MVVAQVIGDLGIGGAERLFVNLCNALDVDKVIVVLVGKADTMPNLRSDLHAHVEVRTVRIRQRSWIRDVWKLSRLFRETGCDVVHTHMFWSNLYGSMAAHLAGVPVIVTAEHGRNEWKRNWHKWVEANVISRYADTRLCVSQDILQRRRDVDGIPGDLLELLPNGTIVPPPFDEEKQANVIGSVGRLVDAKDYPTLVRAIGVLARHGSRTRLEIVGEGPERKVIEETIRAEGVESRVTLTGSQTNVGDWLARWSVFVSSSVREGQPVALLEAMAAGLPCVVTAVGGVPDTLAHGVEGIVIPPQSPEALAAGIQKLLDSVELRNSYGWAARERVIREFSIDTLASKCRQIYTTALRSKVANSAT